MTEKRGEIIIPAGIDIWPHELETAKALAHAGRTVEFQVPVKGSRIKTPDISMSGALWEIKCPSSKSLDAIERNIRRACKQSKNVVLDTRRMKGPRRVAIEKEARRCLTRVAEVRQLILIVGFDDVLILK